MGENEKESVVLSVAVWLLMSTVLSLSSGCRSSLSRPWKLWPLQRGWGQISLSRSHHGPACSERPAPFRFYQACLVPPLPLHFHVSPFYIHSLLMCGFCFRILLPHLQAVLMILVVSEAVLLLAGHRTSNPPTLHVWYLSISQYHWFAICLWPDTRFLHPQWDRSAPFNHERELLYWAMRCNLILWFMGQCTFIH